MSDTNPNDPADQTPSLIAISADLRRMADGDASARSAVIEHAQRRLALMVRRMMSSFGRLKRWEQDDDVLQGALIRLNRALADVTPDSPRAFFGLAALQIRRELIDLSRKHFGPQGGAGHHASLPGSPAHEAPPAIEVAPDQQPGPATWAEQSEVHEFIAVLTPESREVFDLLHYNGLSQAEAADLLGVSVRTVKRRWRDARIELAEKLTDT